MDSLDDPYRSGNDGGVKDQFVVVLRFELRDGGAHQGSNRSPARAG